MSERRKHRRRRSVSNGKRRSTSSKSVGEFSLRNNIKRIDNKPIFDVKPIKKSRTVRLNIGDKIQVRDTEEEKWQIGTITNINPILLVKLEGCEKSNSWEERESWEEKSKRKSRPSAVVAADEKEELQSVKKEGDSKKKKTRKKKKETNSESNSIREEVPSFKAISTLKAFIKKHKKDFADNKLIVVDDSNGRCKKSFGDIKKQYARLVKKAEAKRQKTKRIARNKSLAIGDIVEMKDEQYSSWRKGIVTAIKPLRARFEDDEPNCRGYIWDEVRRPL